MPSKKSISATRFCKVCFKETTQNDTASLFNDYLVCPSCFHKMGPRMTISKLGDTKVVSLYVYNETMKTLLYQCKGCFDFEMASLFLVRQTPYLKWRYKDWFLVPAPSYKERNEVRGFNHVEEIFRCLDRPFIKPIKKIDNVKQADLNYEERQSIGNHLSWDKKISVRGKKILFVDDIFTTGATARACTKMLLEHGVSRVEVLVMARTVDPNKRNGFVSGFHKKLQQIANIFRKNWDK